MSFLDRLKTKIAEAPAPSEGFEGDPGRPFRRYASAFGGSEGGQGECISTRAEASEGFEGGSGSPFLPDEGLITDPYVSPEKPNASSRATLELLQSKSETQVHTRSRAQTRLPQAPSKPSEASLRKWIGPVSRSWRDNPLIEEVDREIRAKRAEQGKALRGPAVWVAGVARLDRWDPPCPGFRSGEWEVVGRTIRHFMKNFAEEAAWLGWTAIDLFGVHPTMGAARVDCCGALTLPSTHHVTALSAGAITFKSLTYRKRPMPDAVLLWEFGSRP